MANFFVPETLGYEEFSEAPTRLWEEQTGVDPADRNLGLSPISEWDWWEDDYEHGYMGGMDAAGDAEPPSDPAAAAAASPEQGADAPASAAPGSSPSHRAPAASEHSATGPESEVGKPQIPQDVSEVSWRLLKAASLTPEETRDILSTTCYNSKQVRFRSHQPSSICTLG